MPPPPPQPQALSRHAVPPFTAASTAAGAVGDAWIRSPAAAARHAQSGFLQLRGDLQQQRRRVEQQLQRCIMHAQREKNNNHSHLNKQQQQHHSQEQRMRVKDRPPLSMEPPPPRPSPHAQCNHSDSISRLRGGAATTAMITDDRGSISPLSDLSSPMPPPRSVKPAGSPRALSSAASPMQLSGNGSVTVAPMSTPSLPPSLASSSHPMWSDLLHTCQSLQRCSEFVVRNYSCMWRVEAAQRLKLQLDPNTTEAQHRESAKQQQLSNVDDPLNLADLLVELVEEVQVVAQLAIMVLANAAASAAYPAQLHPGSQSRAHSGSSVELTPQRSPSTNGSEQSIHSMSPSPSPSANGLTEQANRYGQSTRTPPSEARGSSDSSGNSAPPSGGLFASSSVGGSKGSSPPLENGQKGHERQSGGGGSTDEAALYGSSSNQRSITPPSPNAPPSGTPICGICDAHASCCVIIGGCNHSFCLACILTHPSFGTSCPCCPDSRPLTLAQTSLSLDAMLFESGVSRWEEASPRSGSAASSTSLAASTEPPTSASESSSARSSSVDSQSSASSSFTVSQLVSKLRKQATLSRADDANAPTMMHDEAQTPSRSGGGGGKAKGPLVEQMLASSASSRRRAGDSSSVSPDSQEAQPPKPANSANAHHASSVNGSASSSIRSSSKKQNKQHKQQQQQPERAAEPSPSASKSAQSGVEMSDAPTGVVAAAASLGGFSCHQCKVSKMASQLRFCDNSKNQPTPVPAARGGVKLKKSCNKKYCFTCLERLYNEEPSPSDWSCPSCRTVCCCANCCRKQGRQTVTAESRQNREAQRAAANAANAAAKKERASATSGSATSASGSASGASSSSLTDSSASSPAQHLRVLAVSGGSTAGGVSTAPPPPGTAVLNTTFSYDAMRSHNHTHGVGHRYHARAQPYGEQLANSPHAQHGRTSQSTTQQQNKQTAHHEQLLRSRGMMAPDVQAALPQALFVAPAAVTAAVPYPMAPSHALRRGVPAVPSSNSSGSGHDSSHSSHLSSSGSSSSHDPHSIRSMVDNDDRQIQAQQEALAASLLLQQTLCLDDAQQTNASAASSSQPVQSYDGHQQQQQQHESLLSPPPSAGADCLPALTSDYLAATASTQNWSSNNSQGTVMAKLREEAMERASMRAAERSHGHRARQAERAALTAAAVHGAMHEGRQQHHHQQQQQNCDSPDHHVPSSANADPRVSNPVTSVSPPVAVDWRAVQQILSSGRDRDGGEFTTFEGAGSHHHHHHSSHHHSSDLHMRGEVNASNTYDFRGWQQDSNGGKESGGSGSGSDDSQRIKVHSNSSGERRSASASRSASGSGSDQGMNGDSPAPVLSNPNSGGESDGSRKSVSPDDLHRAQQKLQEKMVAHQRQQDGQPPPDPKSKRHHAAQHDMPMSIPNLLGSPLDPPGSSNLRVWDPLLSPGLHPHHGHGFGPSQFSSCPPLTTSFFTPFTHSSAMPLMALTGGQAGAANGGSDSDKSVGGDERRWSSAGSVASSTTSAAGPSSTLDPLHLGSWSHTAMMRPPAVLPSAHHSSPFGDSMLDVGDSMTTGTHPVLSSAAALQSSAFNSTLTGVHGAWAPLSASTATYSSSLHPHLLSSHLAAVPSQAAVVTTSASALASNSAGATSSATIDQARRSME